MASRSIPKASSTDLSVTLRRDKDFAVVRNPRVVSASHGTQLLEDPVI